MPKPTYPLPGDDILSDWAKTFIDWVDELTKTVGATTPAGLSGAGIAGGGAEVFVGVPTVGADPLGFYVPATKRLTVPVGYGGFYAVSAFGTCIGGTAANARRMTLTASGTMIGAGTGVGAGGTATYWNLGYVGPLAAGAALLFTASGLTTAADFAITSCQLYRVGV